MPYSKKSPAKKPLVGKQKNLPKELKEKILKSPAKMKKPVKKAKTTTASGSKMKIKLKDGAIKVKTTPSREAKKEGAKGRKFFMSTNMESLNTGGSYPVTDPNKYKSRRAAIKANAPSMMYKSPSKMNSYDKDMMHERELIYDAKKEIHKEDVAKKKHMHVVSRIAGRNSK